LSFRIENRILIAAISLALSMGAVFCGSAAAASSFSTGIVDINAFQSSDTIPFDRAEAAGTQYLKDNLYWARVVADSGSATRPGTEEVPFDATDPASPYYDWSTYDSFVRSTVERGMAPVLTVTNAPLWGRKGCTDSENCSPKRSEFADFAKAAAARYSGSFDPKDGNGVLPRVKYWQAWVEPNLDLFYKPVFKNNGAPSSPYTYRKVLNVFYEAIHSVRSGNVVLAGGLAPNAVPDNAIAPLDFTRRILCMTGNYKNPRPKPGCNARTKADVWAVHPYTSGAPTHFPNNPDNITVAALPRMVKLLRAANKANRLQGDRSRTPLWATEFSWDSNRPDPGGLSWNTQTRWVAQAMYKMFRAGVNTMIWFGLRDENRTGDRPFSETFESGLYLRGETTADDEPKKVLKAFRYPFVANKTNYGFNYWGRTPDGSLSDSGRPKVAIFARKKGGSEFVRVATTRANANGIFAGKVKRRGFTAKGAVKSKISGGPSSVAFGLEKTRDFYQRPFG
jgi:hypothetical protein